MGLFVLAGKRYAARALYISDLNSTITIPKKMYFFNIILFHKEYCYKEDKAIKGHIFEQKSNHQEDIFRIKRVTI